VILMLIGLVGGLVGSMRVARATNSGAQGPKDQSP
jgi:hypothetical protein